MESSLEESQEAFDVSYLYVHLSCHSDIYFNSLTSIFWKRYSSPLFNTNLTIFSFGITSLVGLCEATFPFLFPVPL